MSDANGKPHSLRWLWFIRDTEISAAKIRWLAYELAAGANESNENERSHAELARKIEVSVRTVKNYLQALAAVGLVEKEIGGGRKGKTEYPTNRYRLTFPEGPDEQEVKVAEATYRFDFAEARRGASRGASVGGQALAYEERLEERSPYVALPMGEGGNGTVPVADGVAALVSRTHHHGEVHRGVATEVSSVALHGQATMNGSGPKAIEDMTDAELDEALYEEKITPAAYEDEIDRRYPLTPDDAPITN